MLATLSRLNFFKLLPLYPGEKSALGSVCGLMANLIARLTFCAWAYVEYADLGGEILTYYVSCSRRRAYHVNHE